MIYRSWSNGYAFGFECQAADGTISYIYLNPSNTDGGNDTPNVFVYSGKHGSPALDSALTHIVPENATGPEAESHVEETVLVSVSIPVTMIWDRPMTRDQVNECALENFLDHPAIKNGTLDDLGMFVDAVRTIT